MRLRRFVFAAIPAALLAVLAALLPAPPEGGGSLLLLAHAKSVSEATPGSLITLDDQGAPLGRAFLARPSDCSAGRRSSIDPQPSLTASLGARRSSIDGSERVGGGFSEIGRASTAQMSTLASTPPVFESAISVSQQRSQSPGRRRSAGSLQKKRAE
jgi:hypothetical protein